MSMSIYKCPPFPLFLPFFLYIHLTIPHSSTSTSIKTEKQPNPPSKAKQAQERTSQKTSSSNQTQPNPTQSRTISTKMDRYGASAREYSRTDTYHPRRTSDRASARTDSTRERTTFHSARAGTATPPATSDDDESAYGGHVQHHRGVARDGNGGTRRRHHCRREDPLIEQLRRETREDEARRSGGEDYSDDDDDGDDDFALPRRTVVPRGGARAMGGVGAGTGNGGTHGRRRRGEDPVIERLGQEVREDEARLSGSRCAWSDDSEGETGFGREVGAGRCGNGNGVRSPARGHFDDAEDDGMEGGRRGAFCGGRLSRV